MKKSTKLIRIAVMSMMTAMGVIISPFLRVEGMCPMAHFINVVNAVLLGPAEALICAVLIGIIRMLTMGIPPLALTGAVFGAFLSGILYRLSKGKLLAAVMGEVIGTGIIGAVVSYPVMSLLWGKEGITWFFYVPSFISGTLIGGIIAFSFLRKLASCGLLNKFQSKLDSPVYSTVAGTLSTSISVAAIGVTGYVLISVLAGVFHSDSAVFTHIARGCLVIFTVAALIHLLVGYIRKERGKYDIKTGGGI